MALDDQTRMFIAQQAQAAGVDPNEAISEFERRMEGLQYQTEKSKNLSDVAQQFEEAPTSGMERTVAAYRAARPPSFAEVAKTPSVYAPPAPPPLTAPTPPQLGTAETVTAANATAETKPEEGPTLLDYREGVFSNAQGIDRMFADKAYPQGVEEWKKGAMADTASQSGPFSIRAGRGGFSPSAQVPAVAGLDTAGYEKERNQQSPAVQRLMDEARTRAMQDRAQAAAIETTGAEAEARRAEAEFRRAGAGVNEAQAGAIQREGRTLQEQMKEQLAALTEMRENVLANMPQAVPLIAQFTLEWMNQNPDATPKEMDAKREEIRMMVAAMLDGQFRDLLQSMDPRYSMSVMRGAGMLGGGGI